MKSFISNYANPNQFNEDIAVRYRKEDDMIDYIVDICQAQADTIPYVTFNGYEVEEDENKFKAFKDNKMLINSSRLSLITLHFSIEYKEEKAKIKMPIFIPKLIDNYYFILGGNKYYAIWQIVDASSYNTRDSVIIKSLLMPIILKSEKRTFVDIDGVEHTMTTYLLNLFKKKVNILYYYFSALGYQETLDYFGYGKAIQVVSATESTISAGEHELIFQLNKTTFLRVAKLRFEKDETFKSIVGGLIAIFSKKTQINKRDDIEYWKTKLGSAFTTNTNNQITKAESVLLSFKRVLDDRTRKNLRIPDENKEDIFALIKWMMDNFDMLLRMDNLSLLNKRVRLAEYQINGLMKRISTNTYRILNSKTLTMQKLKSAFNIPAGVIINELQTSELLRYNNAVNDLDLFVCGLKYSNRGPASLGEGSGKTVSSMYRAVHISHLGRLSLNSCSASDPGMNGMIAPFIRTDKFYFDTADVTADGFDVLYDDFDELLEENEA